MESEKSIAALMQSFLGFLVSIDGPQTQIRKLFIKVTLSQQRARNNSFFFQTILSDL